MKKLDEAYKSVAEKLAAATPGTDEFDRLLTELQKMKDLMEVDDKAKRETEAAKTTSRNELIGTGVKAATALAIAGGAILADQKGWFVSRNGMRQLPKIM